MHTDTVLCQIALTRIPQVGLVTARNLVAWCGGPEGIFSAKKAELLKIPGVGPGIVEAITSAETLHAAEQELRFMEQNGIESLFFTDATFPSRLKQRRDAPVMLFFKGSDHSLLDAPRMVAIVGTRQMSDYGRAMTEALVDGLAAHQVVIVSGLAYGIDITAHRRATAMGVPNIGVLGHGLGSIYPAAHKNVAMRMIENGGLLTEYLHRDGPDREHFPMRNRIISGLCDALVVVETANSGGSMISAEFALKHQLEVFAVPGRANDAKSAGCNLLIKSHRARLLESAQDLIEVMGWATDGGTPRAIQGKLFADLSEHETAVFESIKAQPNIGIDALCERLALDTGVLAAIILQLEFKGMLKTHPGKTYTIA